MPKRGYFVWVDGDDITFPVVATSTREAKKIAFTHHFHSDYDWIDVRCIWKRCSDVAGLPIGIVEDVRDALIRGIFDRLIAYPCDYCDNDADLICRFNAALCRRCIENSCSNE